MRDNVSQIWKKLLRVGEIGNGKVMEIPCKITSIFTWGERGSNSRQNRIVCWVYDVLPRNSVAFLK